MVDFNDLKNSGDFACAKLVGQPALRFPLTIAGNRAFKCVDALDSPLNGPQSRNLEPLGLDASRV